MTAWMRGRFSGPVVLTAACFALLVLGVRAQGPPLPGPLGTAPFRPGSPAPSLGPSAAPGLASGTSPVGLQTETPALATPRIAVPALQTSAQVGGAAQVAPAVPAPPGAAPHPAAVRLTLEEAKHRALANNKLVQIGNLNAEAKEFAVRAARADYFPKVTGSVMYFHFNDDLGTVLTGGGRTVSGPRGRPLFTFPTTAVNAAVLNENSTFTNLNVLQPLTDLLKVRQGVKIAQADQEIARLEVEKGIRDLVSGVEQLYWGLLAVQRIRAGALEGLRGAELLAKTGTLEARTALVEARQGLQQADKQLHDLQEQLNALLDLPLCTVLELVEPPLPGLPVTCAEQAIDMALAGSPEVRQAQQTILKAQAALTAGKLDYVPSIAVIGGYANQTVADYIQPNIGYIGVLGSYTFVDWGKRRNVIRERRNLVTMASLKLAQTQDEIRQKAAKAFREVQETGAAVRTAQEMAVLRREAEKKAAAPADLIAASKARALAEVDAVKAELAYRQAHVQLMSLLSGH
jgi:outer membrane protein TolC